jgi:hypothetical protein
MQYCLSRIYPRSSAKRGSTGRHQGFISWEYTPATTAGEPWAAAVHPRVHPFVDFMRDQYPDGELVMQG